MAVIEAADLVKHFSARRGAFGGGAAWCARWTASRSRSKRGQTLGIVGESGCGKTTTAKLVLGLEEPTGGTIRFDGRDLQELDAAGRRHYRKSVQAVFQDPYASLNPRMRIGAIIAEPLVTNEKVTAARECASGSASCSTWSGSRRVRQTCFRTNSRAGNASASRSLGRSALSPRLVVLDEPVSALDVSIRAQILNLLRDLQARLGLSYLFIAHDLAAVAHMSHTIAVMYLGKIVEQRRGPLARPRAKASLYRSAVFGGPAEPSRRAARGDHPLGRGAEPDQPALGLPLPSALPAGDGAMRPPRAAARRSRKRPGRLPPLRGGGRTAAAGAGRRHRLARVIRPAPSSDVGTADLRV